MTWPIGWSWTSGHTEVVKAPLDKRLVEIEPKNPWVIWGNTLITKMYVHGGPFYFNPKLFGKIYIYWGFRPTSVWPEGFGDEGLIPQFSRFLKRNDWGNFAIFPTIRRAK